MPALSPTMEEGSIAKWFVSVGDSVRSGDVIAEIETDKASMEVEALEDGVVDAILAPAGAEAVKVNAPIARLRTPETSQQPAAPKSSSGISTSAQTNTSGDVAAPSSNLPPSVRRILAEERLEASAVTGSGRGQRLTKGDVLAAVKDRPVERDGEPVASPLANRMAQAVDLNLADVRGSGPDGRILKSDVEAALGALAPPVARTEPARAPATLEQSGVAQDSYVLAPLSSMRKTIARRMSDSFRDVPHFPMTLDLEIDRLLEVRSAINARLEGGGVRVSINDLIIKAAAIALRQVPEANASYTPDGVALHRHADIAVAVAIDGGLITPIIRAAETKGLGSIATEMRDLAERARAKLLKPEEFQGGGFSISNLGMFGIKSFSSIINEPHGAILSVGAGEKRPVVRGESVQIATVMSVTLTCDHRVLDGVIGARWLGVFRNMIEDPITMMV
jgi:pyruvate dehydrogenase E2 component (dihydrolipoamide acetyltransferase)